MSGQQSYKRYLPMFVGTLVVVAVTLVVVNSILDMLAEKPVTLKKTVQQIALIKPPPPPPKVEKPPEPEIEETVEVPEPEVAEDVPEPVAGDDPPAGDLLGLDADGSGGVDGFGLLAKKGGRSLIGASGNKYSWYTSTLQRDIFDALSERDDVRVDSYSIVIKLWINDNGSIKRFELVESTADAALEKKIQMAFADMGKLSELPPADIPQPIKLRITSRL